jgi:hypothetical protein
MMVHHLLAVKNDSGKTHESPMNLYDFARRHLLHLVRGWADDDIHQSTARKAAVSDPGAGSSELGRTISSCVSHGKAAALCFE